MIGQILLSVFISKASNPTTPIYAMVVEAANLLVSTTYLTGLA